MSSLQLVVAVLQQYVQRQPTSQLANDAKLVLDAVDKRMALVFIGCLTTICVPSAAKAVSRKENVGLG